MMVFGNLNNINYIFNPFGFYSPSLGNIRSTCIDDTPSACGGEFHLLD